MVQEANSSYKASRAKGQITPPSPIQNVVKMLTAHGTTHRFNLFLSRMRLRSFLLCFKATTISFSTNWLFLLFDHFPIGLFLLICSITLQMKRISLLSFFFKICVLYGPFFSSQLSLCLQHIFHRLPEWPFRNANLTVSPSFLEMQNSFLPPGSSSNSPPGLGDLPI